MDRSTSPRPKLHPRGKTLCLQSSMLTALSERVTEHPWTYALPAGLLCAAYVRVTTPPTEMLDISVVLWAGFFGGLLTRNSATVARRVGVLTGLVASLPVAWQVATLLGVIPTFDQPGWFGVVQVAVLLCAVVVAVLLVALAGAVGATAGHWISRRVGADRPSSASRD